jgi:DNA-binding NarL/FixJ family response regulator
VVALIEETDEFSVVGEADSAGHALEAVRQLDPDIVIMDIAMPGTNGIELLKLVLAERPKLSVLVLSLHDESVYALRALRAGAKGYVMKGDAVNDVITALRKVAGGDIYVSPRFSERLIFKAIHSSTSDLASPVDKLSDRELEVLQLFGKGHSTREIAEALHLSVKTIETHRMHIKGKLGFKDAGEMVRFAGEWITYQGG